MLLRLGVAILLGHAKIDNVDDVGGLSSRSANKEVVGLDVTVDQILLVDSLDSREHLLRDHHNGLDGESSAAVVEQVFERWAEKVDDQNVVEALLAEVVDIRNAGYTKLVKWKVRRELNMLTAADENLVGSVFIP